ncbi:MAG: threonine/serine dehydratase, partial [Alphaproteobacteria bacterium]
MKAYEDTPITPADIEAAAARLSPWIRRTPVIEVEGASLGLEIPVSVVLKLELL